MVVKFMANNGLGAIDYLLNNRVNEGTSKVLSGNEILTRRIIQNMSQKNKATVGVLSFHQNDFVDDIQKKEIMDSFEKAIFSGIPKDEVNILWVEHTDKNRIELNFVIPKINLVTQKSINWYFDKIDRDTIDTWQNIINAKYMFENPKDPIKKRNFKHSKNITLNDNYEELNNTLHEMVGDGTIKNRAELIEILKQSGYEVKRQGQDYISIQSKNMKKAKRFTGAIYEAGFTEPKTITTAIHSYERKGISGISQRGDISSQNELEQRFERLQRSRKKRFVEYRAKNKSETNITRYTGHQTSYYRIYNQSIERAQRKRREDNRVRAENRNFDREKFDELCVYDDGFSYNHSIQDVGDVWLNSAFSNEKETREWIKEFIPNHPEIQDMELNKNNIEELETILDKGIDDGIKQRNAHDKIHDRDINLDAILKSCGGSSKGINPKNKLQIYNAIQKEVERHNSIQRKINLEQTHKIKRGY